MLHLVDVKCDIILILKVKYFPYKDAFIVISYVIGIYIFAIVECDWWSLILCGASLVDNDVIWIVIDGE